MDKEFKKFSISNFTLEVWSQEDLIFRSKKEGIAGLIDFIKKYGRRHKNPTLGKNLVSSHTFRNKNLIVFDRVVGNAAALLFSYLKIRKVYGVLGSSLAQKTLKKFRIKFYFKKTIPNILNKDRNDLCPLEKASLLKKPEEFYRIINHILNKNK